MQLHNINIKNTKLNEMSYTRMHNIQFQVYEVQSKQNSSLVLEKVTRAIASQRVRTEIDKNRYEFSEVMKVTYILTVVWVKSVCISQNKLNTKISAFHFMEVLPKTIIKNIEY